MSRIRFDVVCKCPECGHRFTSCNSDYKCRVCGANVKEEVDNEIAKVNSMTLLIPILIVVVFVLNVIMR